MSTNLPFIELNQSLCVLCVTVRTVFIERKMLRKVLKKKYSFYALKIFQWEPKNIHDSIVPVLILNWITGLNIFEYPLAKPRPVFTFIYVLLLNFSYLFVAFSTRSVKNQGVTQIGRNIFLLIVCVNVFVGTCSILIGWYNYKVHSYLKIKILFLLNCFSIKL